ncbi:retropepsin-like aspartic protease [Aspergillus affinis]|uniref:retropepsin-like aspartic protease n=1 Tax=Aspergillus affinis TaxID=1070780 RepID=UPI0022FEBF9D|nr:uncharacterized protein KD926_010945 [Aspergillus affinis]KAI9038289.1 hypothetical protein KD926_010945 [Aspergillus affinis]
MSILNSSREDVQQRPSSRKPKRRRFIWFLNYILPPSLFNLRQRRTEQVSPAGHFTVASSVYRNQSTQTPTWDPWSTAGFEEQLSGPSTPRRNIIYSQSNSLRVPFLPEDDHPLRDGLAAKNFASGLTPLSSSSSDPSFLAVPDFTETTVSQYVGTEHTTPFVLDNDTGDIPGVMPSPTGKKNLFLETAYIISPDGTKGGVLMVIDTQSCCNLLSVERSEHLGLEWEPYDRVLYPLQTVSSPIGVIRPYGIVRDVEWHISGHMITNISDFLVVDMKDYDAVLGQSDIIRYEILRPGPGLERPAVDRNLTLA